MTLNLNDPLYLDDNGVNPARESVQTTETTYSHQEDSKAWYDDGSWSEETMLKPYCICKQSVSMTALYQKRIMENTNG